MQIRSNDRVAIFGKTGSGKSTLAKRVLWPSYTRRIYHDIKCENNDLLVNATLCRKPDELKRAIKSGKVSLLYQPDSLESDDFNQVCRIVYETGNFALFVDEVAAVCDTSWIEPWQKALLMRGRSRGIGQVNLSQRPRSCHNIVISEAEHMFVFKLNLQTDIKKIGQFFPNEYHNKIYDLPPYHCFYTDTSGIVKPLAPVRI